MSFKQSDSAILNLGDIGEENTFSSTITPTNMASTVHSFEDKIPDSAIDGDDDGKWISILELFQFGGNFGILLS